jgi:hypothetical protein
MSTGQGAPIRVVVPLMRCVAARAYRQPMRRVHPPKPVQVRHGDAWWPGWLEVWRRDSDWWRAYVRYSVGVGMCHVRWVGEADVRLVPPSVAGVRHNL